MPRIGVDCVIMEIGDGRSPQEVASELTGVPGVAWSQPLNEFRMQGTSDTPIGSYNDRLYRAQPVANRWHLADLHRVATGRGVTIAVVDSRIDTTHPDLTGQIAATPNFAPIRDQEGERHGTRVAGIIAARVNNVQGIAGIAPGARVLGVRACWEKPRGGATVCDSLSLAKALTYTLDSHADIVNLSLSGPRDRLLEALISLAISRGTTVVAAVDEMQPEASFPAFVAGVIPVADERLSARANAVYIAPGRDIPTTEPEGKWNLVNGSSFAAAHVSGLVAILRQLSGNHGKASAAALLGSRGPVDACAAVERLSRVDVGACQDNN
ncbi:S8 family peptidase [Sphingobium subterraneum]|uniref:Subtilisin family serine protease n=1 Tax=Sphingobium subterraneum TaxID=627688 RepID=A0A841J680_9SPHN|nr:S8 family serine peptidase [Sphingobium subterraneum]MBB6125036.1 subtilisin family serine protease [Sphingobium subterraneum]